MPDNGHSTDGSRDQRLQHVIDSQPGSTISQTRQRAAHFDLQSMPALPEWRSALRINVFPQDPFVHEPVLRTIPAAELREGVVNDRFRVRDSRGIIAKADARGDFLFHPHQPEFDQINALYYATGALRMCERYAGRPLPWSFGMEQLLIDPCFGTTEANAFYHETDRMVAFFTFKVRGEEIRAAQSADIITHEVGHAILDGLRDLLNVSFSFGPEAFHESFCDSIAMLVTLHDYGLIERLLEETKGDLRTESFLTFLAEQFGKVYHGGDPRSANVFYLRNALNNLRAERFDKLPYVPENRITGLGREAHSYSRVYTGALYNILVGIYEHLKRKKWSPSVAVAMARDVVGELLIRSVELGPVGESSLEDFAWAMLVADKLFHDGAYSRIIEREFTKRRILKRAQIAVFEADSKAVPDLTLPATVIDAGSAQNFLEDNRKALGLPDDLDLLTHSGYRDQLGNRFITYSSIHTMTLDGAQFGKYAGQTVPLYGGAVLMFDAAGKLRHFMHRPVLDEDIAQAKVQIADMLAHRHLAFGVAETGRTLGMLERRAIVTVGTDRKPTQRLFSKVDPDFTAARKGMQIPGLSFATEVIRVSMQVIDQPKIAVHARAWLEQFGLPAKKSKRGAKSPAEA